MGYRANVLKILIASPSDVAEERRIVTEECHRWNDAHSEFRNIILQPLRWESNSTPRLGQPAQAELNEQIAQSADLLVGIFGIRIGTPTERHVSGTVEEIKNHVAAGKVAKVYFSDTPTRPSTIDHEQYQALQAFKEECRDLGLYSTYSDTNQFRQDFKQHLDIELNAARFRWLDTGGRSAEAVAIALSGDATQLLLKAAAQQNGMIMLQRSIGETGLHVGREALTDGTSRSSARWLEALRELENRGYVRQSKPGSSIYEVTHAGYALADKLEAAKPLNIAVSTIGPPKQQGVSVKTSRPIVLRQIDYLHSTGACIVTQRVERSGDDLEVVLERANLLAINNSARPGQNALDGSGPMHLRFVLEDAGKPREYVLPVHLAPHYEASEISITVTGSASTELA